MFKNRRLLFPASFLVIALLACNAGSAIPAGDVSAVETSAAGTAAVLLGTVVSGALPSDTPAGPVPTATNTPVPSATGICDQAAFVSETVPDGTVFAPGASFTKSWRLRNTGACTWNTSYALVFDSGNSMSAPAAIPLTGNVAPGAEVDLPVTMQAPGTPGTYTGYWRLRNGSGVLFGLGASEGNFWVKVSVVAPTATTSSGGGLGGILIPLPPLALAPSVDQVVNQVTVAGGAADGTSMACPSGSVVTGGGFAGNNNLFIYNSSATGNGWEAYAQNTTGSGQLINAYAICLSNTSGTSQQVLAQASVPGGSTGNATATCPSGSFVTGGGFAGSTNLFIYNSSISGNGWQVYAQNLTGSGQTLNAYAICLSGTSGSSQQVLAQTTIAAGDSNGTSAACPSGTWMTGGGFAIATGLFLYNTSATGNGWETYAQNTTGSGQLLNTYAICSSF